MRLRLSCFTGGEGGFIIEIINKIVFREFVFLN